MKLYPTKTREWGRLASIVLIPPTLFLLTITWMTHAPGESFQGPLPPPSQSETDTNALLKNHVMNLCHRNGERSIRNYEVLVEAQEMIIKTLKSAGYTPHSDSFTVLDHEVSNIVAEIPGARSQEIIVVGAHYDTCIGSGANDNASGTAAVLALAKLFAESKAVYKRTIRFVAFVNEEPPFFKDPESMGSRIYAKRCRLNGESISAMLSLETIGCYKSEPESQRYPFPLSWFYPNQGNFIAFVGNLGSRSLVHTAISSFRERTPFPSEGATLPSWIPGVDWSDHWSFWEEGFPAMMITDTAFFRSPEYHTSRDTPEKLDYESMARVVVGIRHVIEALADN